MTSANSCGIQCCKYLLFAFNFIIWLAGAALLGLGIWIKVERSTFDQILGSNVFPIASIVLMVSGALIFVIGFTGCLGALKGNKCLLGLYFVFIFIIFAMQVSISVMSYYYHDEVRHYMEVYMNHTMTYYYGHKGYKSITDTIDQMQQNFNCCGSFVYLDWKNANYFKDQSATSPAKGTAVPQSCCRNTSDDTCNHGYPKPDDLTKIFYKTDPPVELGCIPALEQWLKQHLLIIGGLALGVALVELAGMVATCALFWSLMDNKTYPVSSR